MARTAAAILRELAQAKAAQIKPEIQKRIISELEKELEIMYGMPDTRQGELNVTTTQTAANTKTAK